MIPPKVSPSDPNAKYCVSISRYYDNDLDAKIALKAAKDAWPNTTAELHEWKDEEDQWVELDSYGF